MGNCIPARIQLGGTLQAHFVPELIDLLKAHGLRTRRDGQAPARDNVHEEFCYAQIRYRFLAKLEDFAIRHGLAYEFCCSAGSKLMETTHKFTPQCHRIGHVLGSRENGFYLAEAQLHNGPEFLAWMKSPLPPLEIASHYDTASPRPCKPGNPSYCVKITQVLRVQKSTIITVEAEDEADLAAMIEEGSLDVPCADDDTFDVWTLDNATLENETQEPI